MEQCKSITQNGTRCTRKAKEGYAGFCNQHFTKPVNDIEPASPQHSFQEPSDICSLCGCSKAAVEHFGWDCKPSLELASQRVNPQHSFQEPSGVCSLCGCSKAAVEHFSWDCKPSLELTSQRVKNTKSLGERLRQEKEKWENNDRILRTLTNKKIAERLTSVLSGRVLRRSENEADRDYSGGGYFFEKSEALFLYADLTFRHEVKTFSSVSSGGLSMPLERTKSSDGRWEVKMLEDKPSLVLKGYDINTSWQLEEGGGSILFLDGKWWEIYRIRT